MDLARIFLLLRFDIAALMGYTGEVFTGFFGTGLGLGLATAAATAWLALPLAAGERAFRRKDF